MADRAVPRLRLARKTAGSRCQCHPSEWECLHIRVLWVVVDRLYSIAGKVDILHGKLNIRRLAVSHPIGLKIPLNTPASSFH